ncbi:MAG: HigA family addiction module antitoxin [Gammaproteobacteria bacterium]
MIILRKDLGKTDFSDIAAGKRLPAVRPGEILKEDFLEPLDMTPHALSLHLHVPASRIIEIVNKSRPITPDTAARLATFFGTSADFWLGLQTSYDLETQPDWKNIRRDVRPLKHVVNG